MEQPTRVKVKRKANYMGFLRSFKIYVDDKNVATVGNGKEVEFEVPPGHHRIDVLGSLWAKSTVIEFDSTGGETLTFECGVEGKLMYPFFIIIVLSYAFRTAIKLVPGGKMISLLVAVGVLIYAVVMTVMTFQRGTVYYLKKTSI